MSNPADNGSWNSTGHGDPYGQNSASDPYGQPGQPSASDPYGQPGQPSASDPYGQPGQPSASDPYGQPGQPSASDPYGQPQPGYSAPYQQSGAPAGATAPAGQSRMVAGLLGIFLGGWGIHRFILGYTTIGIIQIAVTLVTCGIGGLWGFIEGILILAKVEPFTRDAQGRPLTD